MTIQAERTEERSATCKAKRHTPLHSSWNAGCRCPGAIAAHEEWLKTHKQVSAAVDEDGRCIAPRHDSIKAYLMAGCRCPQAVRLNEYRVKRQKDRDRAKKAAAYSRQFYQEVMRTKRLTGGRLEADPRRDWRGGIMAVDRNNLRWLLQGFVDSPTRGERLAAVCRLWGDRPYAEVPWWSRPRRMLDSELAAHIGTTPTTLVRLHRLQGELRDRRTERRLADAKWRAAYTAAGADRRRNR